MTRPRRSHLFMPGSNPRALEKARTVAADQPTYFADRVDHLIPWALRQQRGWFDVPSELACGGSN